MHKQAFSRTGEIVLHFAHTGRGERLHFTHSGDGSSYGHTGRGGLHSTVAGEIVLHFLHTGRGGATLHTHEDTRVRQTHRERWGYTPQSTDIRLHGREKQLQRRARREKLSFDTMLQLLKEDDEQGCMAYKLGRSLHRQRVFVLSEYI